MNTGLSLFKSKVARRMFFLFLICAMLPITLFSGLSFFQVSAQLEKQGLARIQSAAKSYGLTLLDRFQFLDQKISMIAAATQGKGTPINEGQSTDHFLAMTHVSDSGHRTDFIGTLDRLPEPLPAPRFSTTRIIFEPVPTSGSRIFLVKRVLDSPYGPGLLVGQVNPVTFWGIGYDNILPPMTDVCILDQSRTILFSSYAIPANVIHRIRFDSDNLESRSLEYVTGDEGFFIGYWPMFLQSRFEAPNLIVALRNTRDDVFAPLFHFKILFPLVALLSFWVVLLLSLIAIRKSMVPLEKLNEGAGRLALRQFDTRVDVRTGDEFEVLADTFNRSADRLGRHFHAMEAMADIDRAVHASLNTQTIVATAMEHMYDFFSCASISFGLARGTNPEALHMFTAHQRDFDALDEETLRLSAEDRLNLVRRPDLLISLPRDPRPSFLPRRLSSAIQQVLAIPLFHHQTLAGLICLGHMKPVSFSDEDMTHIQRLASQVSSSLSNARLVEELESLNWGTLEALARTVDAKSKWTAGHSERVSELAVRIARAMDWDDKDTANLQRAGLLHDIGKIGIPMMILDKPDKLSDAEYGLVKEHPVIGAKIIEPIEAYADAIPIILEHHERYDGKGYPLGLSGDDISPGARILAVADVYDAIVSNRPYRQGWVQEKVIRLIMDESGKHFDPRVVDAFLTVIEIGQPKS
ncbi:hypothetical protein JCM14469_15390 [Desulfatiferula olefinivorans]